MPNKGIIFLFSCRQREHLTHPVCQLFRGSASYRGDSGRKQSNSELRSANHFRENNTLYHCELPYSVCRRFTVKLGRSWNCVKMSADDFQSKYASVMDGMLKAAIAETTKLFETMVDELKSEISRIKSENEDLKTRCRLFESASSKQREAETGPSSPRQKRDTAVQCGESYNPVRLSKAAVCNAYYI